MLKPLRSLSGSRLTSSCRLRGRDACPYEAGDVGHPDCLLYGRRRPCRKRVWSRLFARPGGNVTGLSAHIDEPVGKRLEQLREVIPAPRAGWRSWAMPS